MLGDGTCHSSIGLVFWKLGRRNYVCSWTWKLERWTCHSSIGLVILKVGLRPSFILNDKLCLYLDLDVGRWDLSLQHWTCLLEAGPSAQLHSYKEIMFVSGLGSWGVELVTPALDLSFRSWAHDPASFLIRNYLCFWTWKLGQHWTCLLEAGP